AWQIAVCRNCSGPPASPSRGSLIARRDDIHLAPCTSLVMTSLCATWRCSLLSRRRPGTCNAPKDVVSGRPEQNALPACRGRYTQDTVFSVCNFGQPHLICARKGFETTQ